MLALARGHRSWTDATAHRSITVFGDPDLIRQLPFGPRLETGVLPPFWFMGALAWIGHIFVDWRFGDGLRTADGWRRH